MKMYDVFELFSGVSMSMLKVVTIKSDVLGHTIEDDNLEPSGDGCRTKYKDNDISSEDKGSSSKFCSIVATVMSNYEE